MNERQFSSDFVQRHIGSNDKQIQHMLDTLGEPSLDALINKIVPGNIRLDKPLALEDGITEAEALAEIHKLASLSLIHI